MTAHRAPLRFATYLAPNMLPVYRFLAERIGGRLGCPVELVVGSSFEQFEQGEADLGVICGLPYVWLAARQPAPVEPLATPTSPACGSSAPSARRPSSRWWPPAASPARSRTRSGMCWSPWATTPTARTTLAHGFIQGFARVDDAAYDDLRVMLAMIEAAGWTSLTQPTAG